MSIVNNFNNDIIVRNPLNANERNRKASVNKGKSLTLPDQSLSIKQLIDRFTKGLPTELKDYGGSFHGDKVVPDLNKMDLSEQQEYLEFARDMVKQYKKNIQDQIDAKKAKEQAEFSEWKAKRDSQSKSSQNDTVDQGTDSQSNVAPAQQTT